jgi:hypothetical protein
MKKIVSIIPKKHFATFDEGKRLSFCDYIVVTQSDDGKVIFYSTCDDWLVEDLEKGYLQGKEEDGGFHPLLYGINRNNLLNFITNEVESWQDENSNSIRGHDDSFLGKTVKTIEYISRFGCINDITDRTLIEELKDLKDSLNRLFND